MGESPWDSLQTPFPHSLCCHGKAKASVHAVSEQKNKGFRRVYCIFVSREPPQPALKRACCVALCARRDCTVTVYVSIRCAVCPAPESVCFSHPLFQSLVHTVQSIITPSTLEGLPRVTNAINTALWGNKRHLRLPIGLRLIRFDLKLQPYQVTFCHLVDRSTPGIFYFPSSSLFRRLFVFIS